MSSVLRQFEKTMERWSGRNIEDIRREPIDVARKRVEQDKGRMKVVKKFPFIGRGNIQRDNVISNEEIEKELDAIFE